MKNGNSFWTVLWWIAAAALAVFAFDCLLLHPAGRWQMIEVSGAVLKMDTTTGNIWRYDPADSRWVEWPLGSKK